MYLLCLLIGIACLWDYSSGKIPNFLQFNIFSIGLIYSFCSGGEMGIVTFLAKIVIMGFIFFPLFVLSMIGGGDVKIIALSAGYFPFSQILWFVFYLMISASLIALVKMLIDRNIRERWSFCLKYIQETISTGIVKPYHSSYKRQIKSSIVMSGPVMFSVLLAMGGVY